MNDQAFASELAQLLEVDVEQLQVDTPLDQFDNWDSLTQISVLALVRERYRRTLGNELFNQVITFGELLESIRNSRSSE
ncbi:hypothetical protein D3C81_670640 [compost metagenome]|jgi:acyl carrier protein|uniref:acyl carrier protein n=1 Tax=Pseudomonas putida TaxID=303 RepID=UPI000F90DCE1|nr:phosphopantetheine-binding protein [Pseudomonas putida]